jgi:hypothetical protein
METKTIEYLGPFRPPWKEAGPRKIVTYFDDVAGINKTAILQFIGAKGEVCICKNIPEDAAFKLTSSSEVFIEFVEGTKYAEKRIVGLKATKVNQEELLQDKLTKVEKELEDERRKNALTAQQVAYQREADARDNPPPPPVEAEGSDAKDVEKKELIGEGVKN